MLKSDHGEQGHGARAGLVSIIYYILDLGRGSGEAGRGGGGAETACAVRRKRVGAEGGSWAAGLGGWCGGSRACGGCCGGWGSGWRLELKPGWEGGPLEEGRHCVSLHAAESASAAGLLYFSQRKGIFPSERGGGRGTAPCGVAVWRRGAFSPMPYGQKKENRTLCSESCTRPPKTRTGRAQTIVIIAEECPF